MCPSRALSTLTSLALLAAVVTAAVLRATASAGWRSVFAAALAMLAVRIAVMAWRASRRELPWSRLLLPGIFGLEGAGLWWRGADAVWQLRLATAAALELAFVWIAVRELRRAVAGSDPPETRLAIAFGALLPARAARLAAVELVIVGAALRLVLGDWRRGAPAGFSYHRKSGLRALLPVLPLLAGADALLVELVILPHAPRWLAVVLHVVAIYGLLWLLGVYASLRARPHQLAAGRLALRRGVLGHVSLAVDQIASIAPLPSFADDWKRRAYGKGAIRMDVAGPTILELRLRSAARPVGVLGDGVARTRVLVAVDDPDAFTAAIARARGEPATPARR